MPRLFLFLLLLLMTSLSTGSTVLPEKDIPEVNRDVLAFAESKLGTQVDRGECWDLIRRALDYAAADWEPPRQFGETYDPQQTDVLPGDILEFKDVTLAYERTVWTFPQHFAIIKSVEADGKLTMIHQNFNQENKVFQHTIPTGGVQEGELIYWRPQPSD